MKHDGDYGRLVFRNFDIRHFGGHSVMEIGALTLKQQQQKKIKMTVKSIKLVFLVCVAEYGQ